MAQFDTHEQFFEESAKYVAEYAPEYNISVVSAILAQSALESTYGNSELAIYARNFYGLKYSKEVSGGGKYIKWGSEQNPDGSYTNKEMEWCTFDSLASGIHGYFEFLFNRTGITRYDNLIGITDPRTYLETIKADGYCTSIDYVDNCMRIVEEYNLTKYDPEAPKPAGYTNSPLATCVKLSPNYTSDRVCIDRITIHHTATGPITGSQIGDIFAKTSRGASCNYGIGTDGSICLIVEEKNRAWTSSNRTNDQHAITYEVSNSAYGEPWPISPQARDAFINLSVDICKRYGIKEVFNIQGEINNLPQSQRAAYANNYVVPAGKLLLTQHNYFASTACPGTTIKAEWDKITNDINTRLNGGTPTPTPTNKPAAAKPLLKKGSTGAEALNLQKDLNYLGWTDDSNNKLSEDGVLGNCSIQALRKFQANNKLDADGVYGNLSYNAMVSNLASR